MLFSGDFSEIIHERPQGCCDKSRESSSYHGMWCISLAAKTTILHHNSLSLFQTPHMRRGTKVPLSSWRAGVLVGEGSTPSDITLSWSVSCCRPVPGTYRRAAGLHNLFGASVTAPRRQFDLADANRTTHRDHAGLAQCGQLFL